MKRITALIVLGLTTIMVVLLSRTDTRAAMPDMRYGVANAVSIDQAGNESTIQAEFDRLKAIGIDTVMQPFSSQSDSLDWLTFFDLAEQNDLGVVGMIYGENPAGTKGSQFLGAMKDHPALIGFFLVDEPFELMNAVELRQLYQQAKAFAPDVPIVVQFSKEIYLAEVGGHTQYAFSEGMCDICVIGEIPFRDEEFDEAGVWVNQEVSRMVIRREDPDAKIWSRAQSFGKDRSYMPSALEMQSLLDILYSPSLPVLNGLIWQMWEAFDLTQSYDVLSDPQFTTQRQVVADNAPSQPEPTPTDVPTITPEPTPTATLEPTPTATPPTETPTSTAVATSTPTATAIVSPTPTPTPQRPWWCWFVPWHRKCR